ncbi:hypothetical protein SLE2022_097170 [Rubroshorea leprosula]
MASIPVSLFLLFLALSSFEILHAADQEAEWFEKCPPIVCGNFSALAFPFTDKGRPDCGLFTIDGCNDTVQTIQLEKGGRWYTMEGIRYSKNASRPNLIIIIRHRVLLQSPDCEFFVNLNLPSLTVSILSSMIVLKCSSTHNITLPKDFTRGNCNNHSVYYRIDDGLASTTANKNNSLLNLHPNCSLVDHPLKILPSSFTKDLITPSPWPANLSLLVELQIKTDHCRVCTKKECPSYCTKYGEGNRKLGLKLGVGFAGSTVVLIILSILIIKLRTSEQNYDTSNLRDRGRVVNIDTFLRCNKRLAIKRYSFKEVEKMTNKYRDKLGEGGFGSVYKGKLSDGCLVAVKVLNKAKDNGESFLNEVVSISRTSHVNIVTLFGFCFEGRKRALIYEFMPNGSLEKFIRQENPSDSNRQLNWETLYQIAVGIARGLEYLHQGCNTRILHFDIKPHNILLDDDFCPKISDFGLAKLCPRKESMVSMADARGTIGCIAPEVFCRNIGRVSHKSDVYSFGMMVLEMVGERENVNAESNHGSEYFPQWIYRRFELDEELGSWSVRNEDDKQRARKMIVVGLWCIQTTPSDRPPMSKVLEMLQGNLDSLEIPPKPFFSSPPRLSTEVDVDSPSSLIPYQIP